MAARSDDRTSQERAGRIHLDGVETSLNSLKLQDPPLANGQSTFSESQLRALLESIGLGLDGDKPRWIAGRRQLWVGAKLIRQFAKLAPHQTAILQAFEASGWTERIDNPLPTLPTGGLALAKRRLRRTIENLNRSMPPGTIHFRGDGSGFGIRWESCATRK
jgi:hypothetical protein